MPSRVRAWVGMARRSWSSKCTVPLLLLSRPMRLFISVVLPAPLRPMRPAMVPAGSSSETSRRIRTAWIDTLRFSSLSTGQPTNDIALHLRIRERDLRRRVGDDATVVEREHPLREAAHDFHVVLDEKDRGALGTHCREHHFHDAELLLGRDAAGG